MWNRITNWAESPYQLTKIDALIVFILLLTI